MKIETLIAQLSYTGLGLEAKCYAMLLSRDIAKSPTHRVMFLYTS